MLIRIPGVKEGDPITIMNTMSRRIKDADGKFKEILTIVYKNTESGIKSFIEIEDPDYSFYMAKEDKRVNYNRLFIPKDDVVEVTAAHKDVERECAKQLGMMNWFRDIVQSGNRRELKRVHTHPDLFMSDINIEDYYRFWFDQNYKNEQCPISIAYFDIETDIINAAGDFPEMGECPINAISIIFQDTMQVYTFLLRNHNNPQIAEFEKYVKEGGLADLRKFVYDHTIENRMTGEYSHPSLNVENFKYNAIFYDEDKEINMITDFFKLINQQQPDFALAWNEAFDLPYMIERCRVLGYDPAEIMSHPDFKYKVAEYYIDEMNRNEPAERCDFAIISSYTVFLDQMIQFASRRKGQTKYAAMSLDYIANAVCSVGKLDYKNITTHFAEFPYKDYKTFVFYNVCDVVAQYCIEQSVEDIIFVFGKVLMNNTRYSKIHRQTVYLANRGMKQFYNDGNIMGNNINKWNTPPTEKFGGAFVADPSKVSDYAKVRINNHPINVFDNCDDFDYASLYPSEIRQFNTFAYTQIGKLIIKNKIHDKEDKRHTEHWDRGGAFMEDFQSHNWLETGNRWFNLPDYASLVRFVYNLFNTNIRPTNNFGFNINSNGYDYFFPVIIRQYYHPVIFTPDRSQMMINKLEEWKQNVVAHPNQSY